MSASITSAIDNEKEVFRYIFSIDLRNFVNEACSTIPSCIGYG